MFLSDDLHLLLKLLLQLFLLPQLVGIADDQVVGPMPRIIADHLFTFLPQQPCGNQHVQGVVHSPLDVVFVLPLVAAALIHYDFVDQPIRDLLVLGDGKLRDNLINRFREVFEPLGVLGAAIGAAPLVALEAGGGLELIDLLEVIL